MGRLWLQRAGGLRRCSSSGALLNQAGVGLDVVARLATVTVVFTALHLRAGHHLACFRLRGTDEDGDHYRADRAPRRSGWSATSSLLAYVVYDDPHSLLWCAGLLGLGLTLYAAERLFGTRDAPVTEAA